MPILVPNLDDRDFEQLLEEAKRRIPVYTPEWTNFDVESDPGITIVQLFAFLTESLLYRANRIPERDRLKFLELLGIPLRQAAAAQGVITIRNEKAGLTPLTLGTGVVVNAGQVDFLTQDSVTVLPIEVRAYYKKPVDSRDERNADLQDKYRAVLMALQASGEAVDTEVSSLAFYETVPMTLPTPGEPNPVLDLKSNTLDRAVYLAILAPENAPLADVRDAIKNSVLSLGIAPANDGKVEPLSPVRLDKPRNPRTGLLYEIPDTTPTADSKPQDRYQRLQPLAQSDVLDDVGIVQIDLSKAAKLETWAFESPLEEGTRDFPPRLEDERIRDRVLTWLRIRLPQDAETASEVPDARLRWIGVNATRVQQAIPVVNELLGAGNGEPDQIVATANTPIIKDSVRLLSQDAQGETAIWQLTDDLLSAKSADQVFALDSEAGQIRFGNGLRGYRPERGSRLFVSYLYGGGVQGNVGIGAVNATPDSRVQGGFRIENPLPTWGGNRGETQEEGERNIPLILRHRERLVTAQDFEDVTLRTPGVDIGRVEVLPLFHPDHSTDDTPGVVTVMVIPATDPVQPFSPLPDRNFLRTVCRYLDTRRLITTEIFVNAPIYVPVYVSVGVQIMDGYFRDSVIQAVSERLQTYLSSLPPGGNTEQGWSLNRRIFDEEFKAVVTRVAGVDFVNGLLLSVEGGRTELRGLELPILAGLRVVEGIAEPLSVLTQRPPRANIPQVIPVPISKARC